MACGTCGSGTCGGCGKCGACKIAWILIVIGGINWGLQGLGMLIGSNLNVVNLIFGSWPWLEAVIYLLVGIATLCKLFCRCSKGTCAVEGMKCQGGKCEGKKCEGMKCSGDKK